MRASYPLEFTSDEERDRKLSILLYQEADLTDFCDMLFYTIQRVYSMELFGGLRWIPVTVIGIGFDLWILWYFLVEFPADCARPAIERQGRATCALNTGGYIIAGLAAVVLVGLTAFTLQGLFHQVRD